MCFEENSDRTVALSELYSERSGQRSLTVFFESEDVWGCFTLDYLHQISTPNASVGE